jgi:ppGpp synthetase/RelA/SpoT-type nucleotidyltranferase
MHALTEGAADKSVHAYAIDRPKFDAYCQDVRRILVEILREEGIGFQSIEARAKEVESFQKKISKREDDGSLKYKEPLKDVTDLAAVRVIVFTPKSVITVGDIIEKTFAVEWKKDVGEERSDTKNFGYQSVHYLVKHTEDRLKLKEFKKFKGMICEIQVRTILQHAWAEIEHDIQYKSASEIPKEIGRKFRALAGLIEIADREFQSIQDMDLELKDAIQRSAVNDLTKAAINKLESQAASAGSRRADGQMIGSEGAAEQIEGAREYVLRGQYDEALEVFNRNIEASPKGHTQYLGRAKLRFLMGDRSGALSDIEEAEKLKPDDHAIEMIKEQIEKGTITAESIKRKARVSLDSRNGDDAIRFANKALAEGRGEEAFVGFSEAEGFGYNRAFTTFGKAMACALVGDTKGAASFLGNLKRFSGTPMEINIVALRSLIDRMEERSDQETIVELEALLEAKADFDFAMSPLKYLKSGLDIRSSSGGEVAKIFDLLNKHFS